MYEKGNYSNNGRVAVITGSSKGIGKAVAMGFAKSGYSIVMNARLQIFCRYNLSDFMTPSGHQRKHLLNHYNRII